MTVRHASKLTRAQRRDLNKKNRMLRQTKKRVMQHEALETRQLLTTPQLVGIQPNSGELLQEGDIRGISPRSLTFNFADPVIATDFLDESTLADGIRITRAGQDGQLGTADDVIITGAGSNFEGFIGFGDQPNQVVVRFGEALPDDLYRIEITDALKNLAGETAAPFTRNFELNLAPQVMSVVPQPIERDDVTGELVMQTDKVYVYFNNDDLDPQLAVNPDYYQLTFQQPVDANSTNADLGNAQGELAFYPTSVEYDAELDRAILTFANDIDKLVDPAYADAGFATVFRLQIGVRGIISKDAQVLDLTIPGAANPGTSFDSAYDLSNSSGTLQGPEGIEEYTNANLLNGNHEFLVTQVPSAALHGTTFTINDGTNSVTFELSIDGTGTSGNTIINMSLIGPTSVDLAAAIRAAINNSGLNATASEVSGYSEARTKLRGTVENRVTMTVGTKSTGIIVDRSQSIIISSEIRNNTSYDLTLPGGNDEPGHRDIEVSGEEHLEDGAQDTNGYGVEVITYNFPDIYGYDPGSTSQTALYNQITEAQKQRAREIFEIYGFYAGVTFVEVPNSIEADYGIVTGDLRAISPNIITGEGGVAGLAGQSNLPDERRLAIMELADHNGVGDDELGAAWQRTAFHEIGHLLGLDHTYDLPPGTLMGADDEADGNYSYVNSVETLLPGDFDINHLQHLYRPDVIDIDMYRFEISETGTLSAEIVAERLADASQLDAALTLYRLNGNGSYSVVGRNDDYFSEDSFLQMTLEPGVYFIGVSASGNNVYDPNIEDSGFGGTSEGAYNLQIRFTPTANDALRDTGASVSELSTMVVRTGGAGFQDGDTITLKDGTKTITFEIDIVATEGDPASLNNPNNVAVQFLANALQSEVVAALVSAINSADFTVYASANGNRIELGNLGATSPISLSSGIIQNKALLITGGTSAGAALDGDLDGVAGGAFNFWFRAEPTQDANLDDATPRTFIVDASYNGVGETGSLTQPFKTIAAAIAAATASGRGDVIRVVGIQPDDDQNILADNVAYLIGQNPFNTTQALKDGRDIILPQGVTMMIDAGAILKFSNASIQVGSTTVTSDNSFSSLQVLGIPERFDAYTDANGNVIEDTDRKNLRVTMTSYRETTYLNGSTGSTDQVGHASNTQANAGAGNWGGILFNQQIDKQQGRGSYEDAGIFLDSIIGADIRYAGGVVRVNGASVNLSPIYMEEARPTVNYNVIHLNSNSALSADPNSFEESRYTVYDGVVAQFTPDVTRVGPDIFGNRIVDNSTNGIQVRISTTPGQPVDTLTVAGRFDDTDIVYVIQDTLYITSTPGGMTSSDQEVIKIDQLQGIQVGDRIVVNAVSSTNQIRTLNIVFTNNPTGATYEIPLSVFHTEADIAGEVARLINYFRRAELFSGSPGPILDIAATATGNVVEISGTYNMFTVNPDGGIAIEQLYHARFDASLVVDPNVVVKLFNARIEVGMGANLIAEGAPGRPVVFTSLLDDRFGFGGTFDTNNNGDLSVPTPGDWSGIYFAHVSSGSLDNVIIAYGGGDSTVAGGLANFNAVEIHQAHVRITNSTFEYNDDGQGSNTGGATRAGHMSNDDAVVFVRGAQPVIVGNNFRYNEASVLSVDTSSLDYKLIDDWGRSTGSANLQAGLGDNQGALIRNNLLTDNNLNGMVVRGGVLTTQSVWDDTDIVHVVYDTIYSDNFHTYGGIRLESSSTQSLVVKLLGSSAGFVATGHEMAIDDRIGGMLHVIGQAGYPVIFTSLYDDTVGAGFTQDGRPQNDTSNDGSTTNPVPGAWQGLTIEEFANDRNVQVVVETENSGLSGPGINGTPQTSQNLGILATDEYGGDDNQRLGFEVNGYISNPSDIDVYRFEAQPGTEVWFDIDRTSYDFDVVLELIDNNGNVIAASDNSIDNTFYGQGAALAVTNPLQKSGDYNTDHWSTNPRDAGMRVVLSGAAGQLSEYLIRVRSATDDTGAGLTSGVYQLNIRLSEVDELAGSTIQFADIRYAENGISIYGQPGHSPVLGESADVENNDTKGSAQNLGNVLNSDRGAISVAGEIDDEEGTDVDWYQFSLDFDGIQAIAGQSNTNQYASLVIDLDFAAGAGGPNTVISVYTADGTLVYFGDRSSVNDDLVNPENQADSDTYDPARGSEGVNDPYIGSIMLPAGTPDNPVVYYVAVSSNGQLPAQMDQYFTSGSSNANVRFEPVNSVIRIVEDHISTPYNPNSTTNSTPTPPRDDSIVAAENVKGYTLADLSMFLVTDEGVQTSKLWQVDPFTGALETLIGSFGSAVYDLAMAPDGTLYAYNIDEISPVSDGSNGNLLSINTGNAATAVINDDALITYFDNNGNAAVANVGFHYNGTTFRRSGSGNPEGTALYAIGNRNGANTAASTNANVLFLMDGFGDDIGEISSTLPQDQINASLNNVGQTNASGAAIQGRVDTNDHNGGFVTGIAWSGNELYAVTDQGDLYRLSNNGVITTDVDDDINLTFIGNYTDPVTGNPIQFEGLSAGPDRPGDDGVEGLNGVLFMIASNGDIYAVDGAGEAQHLFQGGRSMISTGVSGITGIEFGTLTENLWNIQSTLEDTSQGHGVSVPVDVSRDATIDDGNTTIYFGNLDRTYQSGNTANGNASQYTYDFPGGAHGSVITDTFSLEGYSAADAPTLYFNYLLDGGQGDSLQVYASADNGNWVRLGANTFSVDEWRQARVALDQFAGEDNIRLRFDFTTGQGIDFQGVALSGLDSANPYLGQQVRVAELRAVTGADIEDGSTFSVTDYLGDGGTVNFVFEKGQSLSFDSGARFFDHLVSKTDALTSSFSLFDTNGIEHQFIYMLDSDPTSPPSNVRAIRVSQGDSAAEIAAATAFAINQENIPGVIIAGEDLNSFNIQGVQNIVQNDLPLGMHVTGNFDFSIDPADYDDPAYANIIRISSSDTAEEVAEKIQTALNVMMAFEASEQDYMVFERFENIVYMSGYTANVGNTQIGYHRTGDAFGVNSIVTTNTATPFGTAPGLDNAGFTGAFIDDIIVGFAERGEMVTGSNSGTTGFIRNPSLPLGLPNNQNLTGTYQLEIRRGVDYGTPTGASSGRQLRFDSGFSFDTNDRLVQGYSILAVAGANLQTGDQIRIGDGTDFVTFRFYDLASSIEQFKRDSGLSTDPEDGLIEYDKAAGYYSIGYSATDSAAEIAERLIDAINDHEGQIARGLLSTSIGGLGIYAQLNSRTNAEGSNRVDLAAKSVSDVVILEDSLDSDDTVRTAFDLDLNGAVIENSTNGSVMVRTIQGELGDNDPRDIVANVADVDMYRFVMKAGQVVSFNLSTALGSVNGLGATLKLFMEGSNEFGIPTGVVGNALTLVAGGSPGEFSFTATADGVYYVAIAGDKVPAAGGADTPLNYNPNKYGSTDPARQVETYNGDYVLQVNLTEPGPNVTLYDVQTFRRYTGGADAERSALRGDFIFIDYDQLGGNDFELVGDRNRMRDQGQIIISSNKISNSSNYGILIDAGSRVTIADTLSNGNRPHQGAPINIPSALNEQRYATGVTVTNNVIYDSAVGALLYSGDSNTGNGPDGAVPFGRIINNTFYGTGSTDVGVRVEEGAGPTLMNNIIANFGTGVQVVGATSSASTVLVNNLFQDNTTPTTGVSVQSGSILLASGETLFIDAANRNFYLAEGSRAINAARTSLPERDEVRRVLNALGIKGSSLQAPARDITGQLRSDDYQSPVSDGSGLSPLVDIGAFDRSDFTGPTAYLTNPQDDDSDGRDLDENPNQVQWIDGPLTNISIQLLDQGEITDQIEGAGIDDNTVTANSVILERIAGGVTTQLVIGVDYTFDYDATNNIIRLVPISGVFEQGVLYKITLVSDPDSPDVIRDLAGNSIEYNNQYLGDDGNGNQVLIPETRFLIQVGGLVDYGDAPDSYGTTAESDGARHQLRTDFYLGQSIDAELNGQPTADASGDGDSDDGIYIRSEDPANSGQFLDFVLRSGVNNDIFVTATVPAGSTEYGFLDVWIDLNQDGVFQESEHLVVSEALTIEAIDPASTMDGLGQLIPITSQMLNGAVAGETMARFRYSSTIGLSATGLAEDGEVEDYLVTIADAGPNPWHNSNNSYAISKGDNIVTGLDLSILISELRNRIYTLPGTGEFRSDTQSTSGVDYRPENVADADVVAYFDVNNDRKVTDEDVQALLAYLRAPFTPSPEAIGQIAMGEAYLGGISESEPVADSSETTQSPTVTSPVVTSPVTSSSQSSVSESLQTDSMVSSSIDVFASSYSELQMKPATSLMGLTTVGSSTGSNVDGTLVDRAIALDGLSDDDQFDALMGDLADDLSTTWDGKLFDDEAEGESEDADELEDLLALISDPSSS
ncbi:GEVED domain-containing protein [Bremerella sp. JC817]|uniref:GEVED domain-containing protein n=1 Tax=Bremerella sp. JC817 TaxID=3231756 RepID=UPI003459DD97